MRKVEKSSIKKNMRKAPEKSKKSKPMILSAEKSIAGFAQVARGKQNDAEKSKPMILSAEKSKTMKKHTSSSENMLPRTFYLTDKGQI